jgi:hypothetical protein
MKGGHAREGRGEGEGSVQVSTRSPSATMRRSLLIRTRRHPDALKSRDVSFPLTPALFPEEREQHSAPFDPSGAGCRSRALTTEDGDEGKNVDFRKAHQNELPLPGGEGRGEGEGSAQISTGSPLVAMLGGLIRTGDNPDALKSRDVSLPQPSPQRRGSNIRRRLVHSAPATRMDSLTPRACSWYLAFSSCGWLACCP